MNHIETVMNYAAQSPHVLECRDGIVARKNSGELNTYQFVCAMREYAEIAVNCFRIEHPETDLPVFYPRDLAEIACCEINRSK